jgi:hypothetical protein
MILIQFRIDERAVEMMVAQFRINERAMEMVKVR